MSSQGNVIWLTGLSGAGKTTLTQVLSKRLRAAGKRVEILDGDEVRENLSRGLGFSKADRDTNIHRIGFVARLLARNGVTVIVPAISPYRETRSDVRELIESDDVRFVEIFVRCDLPTLIERDVKGLYKKALAGEVKNFTGISDPYEEPLTPDILVDTARQTLEQSEVIIIARLGELGLFNDYAASLNQFALTETTAVQG
ncbi:MAG: adenylyl-sulfate kinase [Acidobacteriota bacterium]